MELATAGLNCNEQLGKTVEERKVNARRMFLNQLVDRALV
ncbi:MAG: hypothetical protein A4E52_01267 [Pelotomaculum sp. PtaB.Bin013]|nr:MAG: hypothetical protein A4E52_01267 [Pelotomaculum sp. PtaB.Bin013]